MRPNLTALVHDVPDAADDHGDAEFKQLAQHMCAVARDAPLAERLARNARAFTRQTFGAAHIEWALADLIVNLLESGRPKVN